MKARHRSRCRSRCPISLGLEAIGDPWSLLIVRDMMFNGGTTFQDFRSAGEKIATNVLTDRLRRLEAQGIICKTGDPADARRFIYRLTEKGIGLAPILVEMVLWVASHEKTDAPPAVLAAMRIDRQGFIDNVQAAWRAMQPKVSSKKRRRSR